MRGKQHTKETKATVLASLEANNGSPLRTSLDTGIPLRTVKHWAKGEFIDDEVRNLTKLAKAILQVGNWEVAKKTLERLENTLENCNDPAKLATTYGILVDKGQLLSGEPTSRSESGSVSEYQARMAESRKAKLALLKAKS